MSFNSVEKLTEEFFVVYANVTTIHLHANQFMKLSDIKRIGAGFPNLRSLSLYGNEVADNKHYRNMVLHCCPKLVQFDFSPVTASERNKVWTCLGICIVCLYVCMILCGIACICTAICFICELINFFALLCCR